MRRLFQHCLSIALGSIAGLACIANPAAAQNAPVSNQTRHALAFFGSHSAARTLSEMPSRTPIQPATTGQISHNGKPFQAASSGPTISPYLNLFRDEDQRSESLPSYFTFVRPQLEQQDAAQRQQRELQNLERKMQTGQQFRTSAAPGAGTQARYMDTAQFYGGWKR